MRKRISVTGPGGDLESVLYERGASAIPRPWSLRLSRLIGPRAFVKQQRVSLELRRAAAMPL